VQGYLAKRSATATKTDTPIRETPQSITVVGEEQVRDQGATTIQEALRYTAGVASDGYGFSTRGDYPRLRGSDPDVYLDGLRLVDVFQFNETRPDPYTLSRFEVLRGPSSMLYGASSIAGLINLISKKPLDVPATEVGVRFGNFNRKEVLVDTTGPLTEDGRLLYRFVGVGRLSDTQVDFAKYDRYVINPSVTWRPDTATDWTLIGLHQRDAFGVAESFVPREGSLFPGPNGFIPFRRFTGSPDYNRYDTTTSQITSLFEHRFDDALILRQALRYSHIDGVYNQLYPNVYGNGTEFSPFLDASRRTVDRFIYGRDTVKDRISTDTSLQARFETGPVAHTLLGGVDFRQYWERARSGSGRDDRPFDLYTPTYLPVTPPVLTQEPGLAQNQAGLYLQEQARLGPWILLASVRHDWVNVRNGGTSTPYEATTGRIGLMYAFENGLTPYVSYATSFNPLFGSLCAGGTTGVPCQPLRGEQIEGGFKYNPTPWLAINGSIYDTVERNRLAIDPNGSLFSVQTGRARVQGGEIEAIATLDGATDLIAAYAYTDARVAAGDNAGARIESVPLHLASLWVKHRFSLFGIPGFIAGGGVRYVGESFDGALRSLNTPAVTLADALVGWEDAHWRAQINVQNIADTKYPSSCLARGDCFLGTRRTILGTLTYKF
jgi:iron complex outermembrane receptor protein